MGAKEGTCRHFNGVQHKVCLVGITYEDAARNGTEDGSGSSLGSRSLPCIKEYNRNEATCPRYEEPTPEEIAARKAEIDRAMDCLRRGVSKCCEAPINEAHVIRSGQHKGHGPRYCSKCGKLQFLV